MKALRFAILPAANYGGNQVFLPAPARVDNWQAITLLQFLVLCALIRKSVFQPRMTISISQSILSVEF